MGNQENDDVEDDMEKVMCPVCRKILFEGDEYLGECPHVVLTYSEHVQDFGYIDSSMIDFVEAIEEKVKERTKREEEGDDDSDLEYVNISDLMFEFAERSDGAYELVSVYHEGLACGPIDTTEYILFDVSSKKKAKKKSKK